MRWVIRGFVMTCLALGPLMAGAALGQSARPNGIPPRWSDNITQNDKNGITREWRDPSAPTTNCRYQLVYMSPDTPDKERSEAQNLLDVILERYPKSHLDEGMEMDLVEYAQVKGQPAALSEVRVDPTRANPRFIPERSRTLMWIIPLTPTASRPSRLGVVLFACRSRIPVWSDTRKIFDASLPPYQTVPPPAAPALPPPAVLDLERPTQVVPAAPTPAAPVGSVGPVGLGQIPGRWPVTSVRVLDPSEVANLSAGDLRLMRNEIFARHGHVFQSADLRAYFGQQSWYSPQAGDATGRLSAIERRNVETIQAAERGARR